ncbi:3-ketosteroid-9-alpha-hydroxylase subunit A [Rhodococcus sp. WB9]|uniref:3-ketosteroid-9-alpha-monooxygenase, oxygenase component n=1 Tax=Rhodococcus opacus TaxID=37919 RepID=A0A2S8ITR1_RHOOP|nr:MULTISPECIES: Rieske 2Fe-2S domain-containing protein [Rhodococcus]PQP18181.1 3-ketosteroid-9-alpha-hydroxylase [Rhodococcus opacus]QDQ90189.1 3-ketosteroid-9-alpha-hydroxylase subunit A [Rhodococcus sp. WB9]
MAQIREIDVGTVQTRFARGWHCLGLTKTFKDGKPHSIEAFGTKLVVFADSKGELKVLDAYCRHMGGDLSQGTVKGDSVACPFHDWRWGGNGKCTSIPYARRVPPIARTRAWLTLEQNGQLFVWNDPEGNPPPENVTIPRIEGAYSDEWTDWTWNSMLIEGSNCREIIDNVVDMAHFFYIHYAFPTYFKNVFEGHIATQYLNTKGRPDVGMATQYGMESLLRSEAAYYGPSYMINPLWNSYGGYEVESVLINCHYPVTNNSFMLQYGVTVKKPTGIDDETADKLAAKFTEGIAEGFLQDVEIWKNKTKIDNPLLCDEDGPVYQLRRWYDQFYVDVADVTDKMTQRFEFEVDTTKANEAWQHEVEENLARQKAEREAAESATAERSESKEAQV